MCKVNNNFNGKELIWKGKLVIGQDDNNISRELNYGIYTGEKFLNLTNIIRKLWLEEKEVSLVLKHKDKELINKTDIIQKLKVDKNFYSYAIGVKDFEKVLFKNVDNKDFEISLTVLN